MDTKKILTANLKPGMVSSEAAYTFSNHLVIQSNTTLTPDIIDKLKYYAVKSIKIYMSEDGPYIAKQPEELSKTDNSEKPSGDSTYFERIQQSNEFKEFKEIFNLLSHHRNANKNDMRFHLTPVRMTKIKYSNDSSCW